MSENIDDKSTTNTIVVGEESAYKSVQALVDGKAEADRYIKQLKAELAERDSLIDELKKKTTIAEELKQIRENKMNTENTNALNVTEDAIRQIALKTLQDENKNREAESNLANCKQAVASVYSDVDNAMKTKANELGCSVEYLEDIAKTNAKAFKAMFGIKDDKVSFESLQFLQGSRQVQNNNEENEVEEFFKNPSNFRNDRAVANMMDKMLKNPDLLNKIKTW